MTTENVGQPITGIVNSSKIFTPGMIKKQKQIDEPLAQYIVNLMNKYGRNEAARKMNTPRVTVDYWMTRLGITLHRVALLPNQELRVVGKE